MDESGKPSRQAKNDAIWRACGTLDEAIRGANAFTTKVREGEIPKGTQEVSDKEEAAPPLSALLERLPNILTDCRDRILKQTDELRELLF